MGFYSSPLISLTEKGLYCEAGDFYIDPRRAVPTAIVTHAHSDHARRGSARYFTVNSGVGVLKERLGKSLVVQGVPFQQSFVLGRTRVSLHSAGHILGSCQVRVEHEGEVWVASGDYKRDPDPSCDPFESVKCDTFITEATFGTPKFAWEKNRTHGKDICAWWDEMKALGKNAVLFGYSLGKAQRILAELHPHANQPVLIHESVVGITERYREEGVTMAPTEELYSAIQRNEGLLKGELIIAPPSVFEEKFATKLGNYERAFASGWMQTFSAYAGGRYDRGFVISDHADWNDLNRTILETGARRVFVQHRSGSLIRNLRRQGVDAHPEECLKPELYSEARWLGSEPMVTEVNLSVRDFAVPSPLTGSIEGDSGFQASSEVGIEIHALVQAKRRTNHPASYASEVRLDWKFTREEFVFTVQGRVDGIFEATEKKAPRIEEIKSTFSLYDLHEKLRNDEGKHPYTLQLLTYGYLFEKNHGVKPDLSFHLVSSRNRDDLDLNVKMDEEQYEAWLERRLAELVAEARRAVKRMKRRKKLAEALPFPFETPRNGQMELISTIEEGLAKKEPMLLQAPTGLGKTVGVLYPTLKESLARGRSVVYVTPKNSQHRVAEDAVERFQDQGAKLKSLTFTAKTKLCLKPEPLCNPKYCEFAKNYYDKLGSHEIPKQLAQKKSLNAKTFKALGEQYEVCPFELQLEAVEQADVVICDYNYVFSARSALKRAKELDVGGEGKRSLVIDEAHNLPSRAMSYYSPELTTSTLRRYLDSMAVLPKRFAKEGSELVLECIEIIEKLRPVGEMSTVVIRIKPESFGEQDAKLRAFLTKYLESDTEIESRDPVLGITFYWGEFTEMLSLVTGDERPEFSTLYLKGGGVKVSCADASEMLKDTYSEFEQVVGFSATLKPFDYYAKLSGLGREDLKTAEFDSPFDHSKRKILVIPQISTKYRERAKNYSRIAETIEKISAVKRGNHLVFFPSFDFLKQVEMKMKISEGYALIAQERNTPPVVVEQTLEALKNADTKIILFAVQGGVYSEGVDYPGDMAIGVFVVGPPLPTFDVERERMREYYQKIFGAGFDYAYTYPAMAKAIQSAGRVIRNESDKGIIVLMDARFLDQSYSKSMPADWFTASPRELVSTQILKDLDDFWLDPNRFDIRELPDSEV